MSKSDYLEAAVLAWFRGTTFPAAPTHVYIGLGHTAPDEDGSPVYELGSDGGYERVQYAAADWSAITQVGDAATISNDEPVTWPTATADYSHTATHFLVFDASTSGNLLRSGALATPRLIMDGDVDPTFAPGTLVMSES